MRKRRRYKRLKRSTKRMLIGIALGFGGYYLLNYVPVFLFNMDFENPIRTFLTANLLLYLSYGLMLGGAIFFISGLWRRFG